LILQVDDAGSGSILGIPADMRGGGGAFGPRAGQKIGISGRTHQKATGGAGGVGGAALTIVCRGGDFGISGQITIDGADALEPTTFYTVDEFHIYGGAGGAGAPGALLWLLDGSSVTFPDIAGHFSAVTGLVTAQFALPFITGPGQNRNLREVNAPQKNMAPFLPNRISGFDQTGVNFRISFLPCDVVPEEDQDVIPSPPLNLTATAVFEGVKTDWTNPEQGTFELIEIWASDDNVRANAVQIAEVAGPPFVEILRENPRTRFYKKYSIRNRTSKFLYRW